VASGRDRVRRTVQSRQLMLAEKGQVLVAPAISTAFDAAFWFCDTALNENEYIQPQKLQRLLYLAQAYYGVLTSGRKLIPSVFVAVELGPIEPNIFRAFANGRPNIEAELFLEDDAEYLLSSIWRRFGHHSPERLSKLTKDNPAYLQAFSKGEGTEITLGAMVAAYASDGAAPGSGQVVKPKVLMSQTGRPVAVKAWVPPVKS